MSVLGEAIYRLKIDKSRLASGIASANKGLLSSVSSTAGMAKRMLGGIFSLKTLMGGLVGGYAFRQFVTPFAQFEQEMDKSLAIMEGAAGREEELERKVRQTAKSLGIAHAEGARGYFYLASAGLDATKSLAAYDTVAKFSVAGSFNMAEATDMLTDSLSALGWASKDATEYGKNMSTLADMIVKGNTVANTSVQQLAQALMGKGAVAMKLFGQETNDGMATLLAMADTGFAKSNEAGTQLYILLNGLSQVWRNHEQELRSKGIVVYDNLTGKMTKMADLLDMFKQAFPAGGKALTDFLAGDMAMNTRAVAALGSILDTGEFLMRSKFVPAMETATGSVDKLARANIANLAGLWSQFKNTIADLSISLNKMFTPVYSGLLRLMGALSEKTREWVDSQSPLAARLKKVGEELSDIAKRISQMTGGEMLKDLGTVFKRASDALWESFLAISGKLTIAFYKLGQRIGEGTSDYIKTHFRVPGWYMREPTWLEKQREAMKIVVWEAAGDAFAQRAMDKWGSIGEGLFEPSWKMPKWLGATPRELERQRKEEEEEGFLGTQGELRSAIASSITGMRYQQAAPKSGVDWGPSLRRMYPESTAAADIRRNVPKVFEIRNPVLKFDGLTKGASAGLVPSTLDMGVAAKQWRRMTEQTLIDAAKKEKELSEYQAPAWQRSSIEDYARTIQDAIAGRAEDKHQKRIAKATEEAQKIQEDMKAELVKLNEKDFGFSAVSEEE